MNQRAWMAGLCLLMTVSAVRADDPVRGLATAREADRRGPAVRPGEVAPPEIFEPIGPVIDPGINLPGDFTIGGYSDTDVGMRWWNNGAPLTRVMRSVEGSAYTEVQRYTTLPVGAYVEYRDQAATPDTEHCYRITVSDGSSNAGSQTTPARCVVTRDGRQIGVKRLQLRLRVANVANADLDRPLEVRLQSPSWLVPTVTNWRPAGNSTWVDSTGDDFERGSEKTYDLMLGNISEVSDITQVTFAAPGNDRLCIAGFDLLVGTQTAFSRNFGNTASTCAWVGGSDVAGVGHRELRGSASWQALGNEFFAGYDGPALRSVLEAQFGHFLHGLGELRSGSVNTTFRDRDRLSVSVPIRVYDVPVLGDVDSTVNFDLVLANSSGAWKLSTANVDADSDDLLGYFLPVIGWKILYEASQRIESQVGAIRPTDASAPVDGFRPCFRDGGALGVCYE